MDCKRCQRNGYERDGGPLGLCYKHYKTKCHICGQLSAGNEFCSQCAHQEEELRWKAESSLKIIDPDDQDTYLALRKERLLEAKHHAHRAVEILFKGILLSIEAMWGDVAPGKIENKEAA